MSVGTVKWFDAKKGFGFVVDDEGTDVFVHFTVIEGGEGEFRRLLDGEKVEFEFSRGPRGLLATRVRRLNPEPILDDPPPSSSSDPRAT